MYCPASDEDFVILLAAASGDLERLQELKVETGDDELFRTKCEFVGDCGEKKCLHYAAGEGKISICRFLIENVKVDINIKTGTGDSPLLVAASQGHVNTAKYFIIRGADITIRDYEGITCLHLAAVRESKELMQLLLLEGADIEADSVHGTPLQCAASHGSVESVRFLLRRGANPNSVSPFFNSPLVGAILCQSSECVELLLKAGADPNISSRGLSPLAVAAQKGSPEFLRSLLAAGANPNSDTTARLKPIEHAVKAGNHEGVTILFPETQSISNYPDWSIHGITSYFHSKEAKIQRTNRQIGHFRLVNQKGKNAMKRNDYRTAVKWFSEAIYLDPSKERVLSNRSTCWAHLHEGTFSLCDAEACTQLRPDWPEAHYRVGAAWMLLNNHHMALGAFKTASRLDPRNEEIKRAYGEAFKCIVLELAEKYLMVTLIWLHTTLRSHGCDTFSSNLFAIAQENPSVAFLALLIFLRSSDLSRLL